MPERRPYSPGLEGVVAGETSLGLRRRRARAAAVPRLPDRRPGRSRHVSGGREPALDRRVGSRAPPAHGARPADPVMTVLRALPATTKPMDALRTAVSAWGATQELPWPPTAEQARALTSFSPSALAAFARLRAGEEPVEPDPSLDLVEGFLYQLTGERPDPATARALDAYFIVGSEHGFNASTFTARIVTSTRSDIASAVVGRDRHDQGPAPRRRAVGGRRPAQPDRVGRRCRGMGPRDARARRPADGLRPSGLSGLRPAGRRAAQGRRGDAQPAGLAPAGDRRRGRRRSASSPRSTRSGRSRPTSSTTRRPSSWASA